MSTATSSTPNNNVGDTSVASSSAATPDSIHPTDWSTSQVIRWLGSLTPLTISKLYSNKFKDSDIVGEVLIQLDQDALKDIGVSSVGHRLVILKGVYDLKIKWNIELDVDDWRPTTTTQVTQERHGSIASRAGSSSGINSMTSLSSFGMIRALQERDERVRALELELARLEDWLVRWTGEMGNPSKVDALQPYFPPSKVYSSMPDGILPLEDFERRTSVTNSNFADRIPSSSYSGPLTATSSAGVDTGNLPDDPPTLNRSRMASLSAYTNPEASQHAPGNVSQMEMSPTSSTATPSATPTSAHPPISLASSSADSSGFHRMASPTSATPSSSTTTAQGNAAVAAAAAAAAAVANGHSHSTNNGPQRSASPSGPSSPLLGTSTSVIGSGKREDKSGSEGGAGTPYKSFRVTLDDPCHKVLPAALKKYKINDDWRQYALFICYGTTERCLSYDEKPLLLFQKLKEAKQSPVFMLRHIRDVKSPIAIASAKAAARKTTATGGTTSSETDTSKTPKLNSKTNEGGNAGNADGVADKKGESAYIDSPFGQPRLTGPASQMTDGKTSLGTRTDSFAIAIYPYVSEREDEFDVSVGDTFIVKSKAKGWWIVQRDAKASGQADIIGLVTNPDGTPKNGGEIQSGWVPAGCLLETKQPLSSIVQSASFSTQDISPKTPSEGTFSHQQQRAPTSPGLNAEYDIDTPKPTSSLATFMANAPIPPSLITSTSTPGILLMDYHAPDEGIHLKKDVRLRVFKRYNHWSYCVEEGLGHSRAWLPSWYIGKIGSSRSGSVSGSSSGKNNGSSGGGGGSSGLANTATGTNPSSQGAKSEAIPLM